MKINSIPTRSLIDIIETFYDDPNTKVFKNKKFVVYKSGTNGVAGLGPKIVYGNPNSKYFKSSISKIRKTRITNIRRRREFIANNNLGCTSVCLERSA